MFNITIKNLEDLKNLILEIKSNKNSKDNINNSGTSFSPIRKNTKEAQVYLDLLTNFPLSMTQNINEIYQFHKYSLWAQAVSSNTKYKLIPLSLSDRPLGLSVMNSDAMYISEYSDKLTEDCSGNIIHFLPDGYRQFPNRVDENIANKNLPMTRVTEIVASNLSFPNSVDTFTEYKKLNLDHTNYNHIQVPTDRLNYYIGKIPFVLKRTKDSPAISSSNLNFNSIGYDLLVYPNKIVYIDNGGLSDRVDYKVFKIPELTVLESGNDTKLNVYTKLKLTRFDIIGPNVYSILLDDNIKPCKVVYGFRILDRGFISDIYMNNIRKCENSFIRYKRRYLSENDHWVLIYY